MSKDGIAEAMNKHKAFFAFGTEQFNERKIEGVKYIALGSGLIAPKETYKQLVEDMNKAISDKITNDLNSSTKKEIIHRELVNHEASYTRCIDDTVEALKGYGITRKEVQVQFVSYLDKKMKWEEEQEAKQ